MGKPPPDWLNPISLELADVSVISGGRGVMILASLGGAQWLSEAAALALIDAAHNLGFERFGWNAVVDAVVQGALQDLLSDAIEQLEMLHG